MGDEHKNHFYGGQAVIEGVMMRGLKTAAIAVRREDGQIVLSKRELGAFGQPRGVLRWPFIRGNVMLIETLLFGMSALQFSADVLAQEESQKQGAARPGTDGEEAKQHGGISRWLMGLTTLVSFSIAIGLFVLLPTWLIGIIPGLRAAPGEAEAGFVITGPTLLKNVLEGMLRLSIVLLYIVAISTMKYVRRVFEYHGAEHATINCYEAGVPVTVANCMKYTTLHPRCGTAFLLVVILLKIILGWFFGWPSLGTRMLIRIALLPIVAAIAYEIIRWAGRHRQSLVSRILAGPGMLMQKLTTRRPDEAQVETAVYALAAVAPDVSFPADGQVPLVVDSRLTPLPLEAAGYPAPEPDQTDYDGTPATDGPPAGG